MFDESKAICFNEEALTQRGMTNVREKNAQGLYRSAKKTAR